MKNDLLDIFGSCSEPKIFILGIGSEFKADDAAGVVLAKNLLDRCSNKNSKFQSRLMIIDGSTAPENYTGDIKKFAPTHLVLVDAAEMGTAPGTAKLIPSNKIGGVSFSTHVLPIAVMINYLNQSVKFETVIIGVEPKDLEFGKEMSTEVKNTVDMLSNDIVDVLDICLNR